jgi:hypothetical protein
VITPRYMKSQGQGKPDSHNSQTDPGFQQRADRRPWGDCGAGIREGSGGQTVASLAGKDECSSRLVYSPVGGSPWRAEERVVVSWPWSPKPGWALQAARPRAASLAPAFAAFSPPDKWDPLCPAPADTNRLSGTDFPWVLRPQLRSKNLCF